MNEPITIGAAPVARTMNIHTFRSRFLDRCGEVETWLVERLAGTLPDDKVPVLLGERMKAVRKAVKEQPRIVKNAAKVDALLIDLLPFIDLRATLAHAVLHSAEDREGRAIHIFQEPSAREPWRCRTTLRQTELSLVLDQLDDLANRLNQQKPTPSSPPRPTPGGAGGP